jgi:sulfur carrier protein
MNIDILLNGEPEQFPAGATIWTLLEATGVDPAAARGIAVAVNEEVVRKDEWKERTLGSGDTVEVVTARQGG